MSDDNEKVRSHVVKIGDERFTQNSGEFRGRRIPGTRFLSRCAVRQLQFGAAATLHRRPGVRQFLEALPALRSSMAGRRGSGPIASRVELNSAPMRDRLTQTGQRK